MDIWYKGENNIDDSGTSNIPAEWVNTVDGIGEVEPTVMEYDDGYVNRCFKCSTFIYGYNEEDEPIYGTSTIRTSQAIQFVANTAFDIEAYYSFDLYNNRTMFLLYGDANNSFSLYYDGCFGTLELSVYIDGIRVLYATYDYKVTYGSYPHIKVSCSSENVFSLYVNISGTWTEIMPLYVDGGGIRPTVDISGISGKMEFGYSEKIDEIKITQEDGGPSSFNVIIVGAQVTLEPVGAGSCLWSFGDGNTSTLSNPIHTYSVHGTYTITLNGTITQTITIQPQSTLTPYSSSKSYTLFVDPKKIPQEFGSELIKTISSEQIIEEEEDG